MPLYEYQCRECAHLAEVLQKFSDPPMTVCSECGGEMKKLFSSPAIQFKGSGFHINDYKKSGSNGNGSKSDSTAKTDAPSSSNDATSKSTTET
jgi:putative FmdB family regulatory protein